MEYINGCFKLMEHIFQIYNLNFIVQAVFIVNTLHHAHFQVKDTRTCSKHSTDCTLYSQRRVWHRELSATPCNLSVV